MVWLTDLADGLRARGLTVVEVEGWKTRGVVNRNPPYQRLALEAPRGTLWHHTATNRNSFVHSDMPTLGLLANGRSDLPGPLCQIGFGRNGTVYVVAAGLGNHAGLGWEFPGVPEDAGNWYLIGIEMESSGIAPWDWTDAQKRVAPYLGAALMDMYGYTLNIGHYEYSKEGKIDPAGWPGGMDGLRAQITAVSGSAAITPGKPDSPQIIIDKPAPKKEWYEMPIPPADLKALHDAVWHGVPGAKLIGNRQTGKGEWAETVLGSLTDRIVRQQITPLRKEFAAATARLQGSVDGLAQALVAATSNPAIDPAEVRSILEGAAEKAFGKYELEVRRAEEAEGEE